MPETSIISVSGIHTPVVDVGPAGAAEAALFVHGNPGSHADWDDLIGRVSGFLRCVAFDMPGFGQADKPHDFDYSVPGYADFIESARSQLGLRRVHLVVHDFGGPFALEWAAAHLADVASVTILNAPPVQGYRWYLLARLWRTPGVGELVQRTLIGPTFGLVVRRGHPLGLPRAVVDRMYRDYDAGTRRTVLQLYRATDAARMVSVDAAVFAAADIPALVVWATADVYMATPFAYRHRDAFPSARVVELPRHGHFLLAEDPAAVAELVLPFLRQQAAAGAA